MTDGCSICARGLFEDCGEHPEAFAGAVLDYGSRKTSPSKLEQIETRGRPVKSIEDVKDPRSTMRKRAQKVFAEANPHMVLRVSPCQWSLLANVGLERHPIVGCRDGIFSHVHHANKDIFDNQRTNLVGICTRCHNLQHSFIDPCVKRDSEGSESLVLAEAREATEEELELWNNPDKSHLIPRADHSECEIMRPRDDSDD